jgi:hypothetical protein
MVNDESGYADTAADPALSLAQDPVPALEPAQDSVVAANADRALTLESGETIVPTGDGQAGVLDGRVFMVSAAVAGGQAYDVEPGRLTVLYQGGDVSERIARVAPDPVDRSNHALEFRLQAPNVRDTDGHPFKGRVQLNAYSIEAVREVRLRTRMFLGDGFSQLMKVPLAFHWLTIAEWWNNAGWTGETHPFRITVDITKPVAGVVSTLHFSARAETLDLATNKWSNTVWTRVNTDVPAPVGRWVTLEYYFREGDSTTGRFYLALLPDEGARVVLFDHRGWTYHPDDPSPNGLTHLNPAKLYTSKALVEYARDAGQPLTILWDNIAFRLCRERTAADVSPCRPEALQ